MATSLGTGKSGKGDVNDTGRPAVPMVTCSRHPGAVSSGLCPACLRESSARRGGKK
jgi:hypothetical protein